MALDLIGAHCAADLIFFDLFSDPFFHYLVDLFAAIVQVSFHLQQFAEIHHIHDFFKPFFHLFASFSEFCSSACPFLFFPFRASPSFSPVFRAPESKSTYHLPEEVSYLKRTSCFLFTSRAKRRGIGIVV